MLLLPFALLTRAEKFCKEIHSWPIREQRSYLCQNVLVEMSLKSTHFDAKNAFALGGQRC